MAPQAISAGRMLTDRYKRDLKAIVEGWIGTGRIDAAAILGALGEVTAEAGLSLVGANHTAELFNKLEKNVRARI